MPHKSVVKVDIEEYLAQPNVLGDDEKEFTNFLSKLLMQFLGHKYLDDASHVSFLHQVDNLAAIGHNLEGLARHEDLLVFEDLPVLKSGHYSREDGIEVFVHGRVLVAELFRLVKQILAQ